MALFNPKFNLNDFVKFSPYGKDRYEPRYSTTSQSRVIRRDFHYSGDKRIYDYCVNIRNNVTGEETIRWFTPKSLDPAAKPEVVGLEELI